MRHENVWDAWPDPEEAVLIIAKRGLIKAICSVVNGWGKEKGYQTRAAARLGTTRAQMCRLLSGQADHFGMSLLFKIAIKAGLKPTINFPSE